MAERPDLRQHLAAERTILAQVRTGAAMIALGFVIARFGLLVRELRLTQQPATLNPVSNWFGTLIVLAGAIMGLLAAIQYRALVRRLNQIMDLEESLSVSTLTVCWVLFVSGLFLALYLFITA
jgi:putative membrane protein